ncbi:MAG: hypothetical protein HY723_04135, partial [Chloroflexi bacterium]|nr:hypothetical protein [Chloroflexota bacterium]
VALTLQRGRMPSLGGWRWYPSPLGLLLLLPVLGLLVWRAFPALLVLPFVLPFFPRFHRGWFARPRARSRSGDDAIDGEFRPLDGR